MWFRTTASHRMARPTVFRFLAFILNPRRCIFQNMNFSSLESRNYYCANIVLGRPFSSLSADVNHFRKVEDTNVPFHLLCKESSKSFTKYDISRNPDHRRTRVHFSQMRQLYIDSHCTVNLLNVNRKSPLFTVTKRFKKDRRKDRKDDNSDEEETVEDYDEELFEEDYDAPAEYKQMKIYVKSHRLDSLLSAGLNLSRKKTDELFYASKLRLNDEKILKKGIKIEEGDSIDVIIEATSDAYKVKRVRLMKTFNIVTDKDRTPVVLRAWRASFTVPRNDTWQNRGEDKDD